MKALDATHLKYSVQRKKNKRKTPLDQSWPGGS